MTKQEAIQQLAALGIEYMDDGTTIEAARTTGVALHIPNRRLIMVNVVADEVIRRQLAAQGWDIIGRGASIHYTDEMPAPTPRPAGLVVTKVGRGFTGEPSGTLVDVRATAEQYRQLLLAPLVAGGGSNAREILVRALRQHVETACPELTRGQAEEQIRLLTNAVLVNIRTSEPFEGYQAGEAYR